MSETVLDQELGFESAAMHGLVLDLHRFGIHMDKIRIETKSKVICSFLETFLGAQKIRHLIMCTPKIH